MDLHLQEIHLKSMALLSLGWEHLHDLHGFPLAQVVDRRKKGFVNVTLQINIANY